MSSSVANAVSLQKNFGDRLNEEYKFLQSTAGARLNEHELRSRLNELEYEFSLVRERHDKIFLAKAQEASTNYLEENVFIILRNSYHKVWAHITEKLPKPSTSSEVFNSTSVIVPQSSKSITELNLPKIDLPHFSGKYEEWMAFDNMFTATVHNNPNIEPIVKLQRLKRALTGDAELIVRNLQLNDQNYTVARTLLSQRYQHTRRLVNSYLKKLYDFPPFKTESSKSLKSLLNVLNDCTSALKQLDLNIEDYQLIYHMCRKLPQSTLSSWEESQGASTSLPKYEKFLQFLETRFRTMEMIEPSETSSKSFHVKSSNETLSKQNSKTGKDKKIQNAQKNPNCPLCNNTHYLGRCEQFKQMPQQERFDTVKRLDCCFNCFSKRHTTRSCSSKFTCRNCKKKHHTLLHRYTTPSSTAASSSNEQPDSGNNVQINHVYHVNSNDQMGTVLGTALVKAMSPVGISTVVRALVDPCSEDNYILASTVQTLHLRKYYSPSVIGVLGDDHSSDCSHRVNLYFKSMDDSFSMQISAGVVQTITSELPCVHLPLESFGNIDCLSLADATFNEPGSIQLLLGVNVHTRIMLSEHKRLTDTLVAEKTLLGYLIRGQVPKQKRSSIVMMTHSSTLDLNTQIKKFWEIEEVTNKTHLHPDDELCENIYKSTIHQDSKGFLTMDLPFKGNKEPTIGPSRYMAVKRFLSLEQKLKSNSNLKNEYHKTIQNYLDSNHLSKTVTCPNMGYYLPHHAVVKESSTTTKVRVVYDASCKSLDGTSLNDHLLTGPKLQRDIRDVLFNWRQYPFAITADIEKMYRMFFITPKHHQFQKIVWRFNEGDPIEDYVLRTATFGTSCAPFLAIRSLQHIAELHAFTNPLASHAIQNEFYVDDFISGGFTADEALDKQTQVRSILQKYHLVLRKWSSNYKRPISNVPINLLDPSKDLTFDDTEFRKTLGIFWSQSTDSFFFSIELPTNSGSSFTKRQILSLIARLYDPLGWVSPCTMLAKHLMQKVWQTKTSWDEIVDVSISTQFNEFLYQLPELRHFSVPRWTNVQDATSSLTVFGFSDASNKGYSAVVYLLNPKPTENTPSLILLTSKTKVADLKFQSIARLELNGALLLSDLLRWTVDLYKPRKVTVKAFCDSKIVLAWLQAHPSRWKTYIANRTSQILDWMTPSQWNYIDTKCNPADCASRGLLPRELISHSLWLNGPTLDELQCDQHQNNHLDDEHQQIINDTVKKNSLVLLATKRNTLNVLTYFSRHSHMMKRMKTVTEFICKLLRKHLAKGMTCIEKFKAIIARLQDTENLVFRLIQEEVYHDDLKCLRTGRDLKKESKLRGLHPFLDGNDVLRVGGRLQNSELTFDQRHPIILPAKHQVVTNLIADAHEKTMHGSELLVQAYLRNRFYLPRMSEKVRNFNNACLKCFRFSKRQQITLMGSLPKPRVNISNPFEHTGVDYAGPLTIKAYKGRCKKFLKCYIAIFVCLCTKAIHIELVSDLTSLAFLAAFKRFVGRRGRCLKLYSDNGTNFVGADKILRNDLRKAEETWKTELEIDFQSFGTEWQFIPPATPHFGGIWEAGVKSIKRHLKKTVGSSLLTFEELNTLLIQIEAVLNSRPLCPMSNNPNEYNFLTPAHFLIGRPLVAPPEKCMELEKSYPLDRWIHIQTIQQRFFRLWKKDYLHNLQNRPKWLSTTVAFKPGDLILLAEDNTPPTLWPTAIIDQVHPGADGVVRVVTIRTASGSTFKRPVVKLRYLPCNDPPEN